MGDEPSYSVTLLLASLPTGWIGIHHWYVGNYKRLVIYILFIWTLIPVILSYIDVYLLLRRGQDRFVEKHYDDDLQEQYYLKKVAENNPQAIDNDALNKIMNDNIDDIETDEVYNKQEQENENQNSSEQSEDEKNYIEEPDYSDYYGNWK